MKGFLVVVMGFVSGGRFQSKRGHGRFLTGGIGILGVEVKVANFPIGKGFEGLLCFFVEGLGLKKGK